MLLGQHPVPMGGNGTVHMDNAMSKTAFPALAEKWSVRGVAQTGRMAWSNTAKTSSMLRPWISLRGPDDTT